VGGGVGEGRGRIGKRIGRYPEEHTPAAIAALARFFDRERRPGEAFPAFVERIGGDRLGEVAKEAASAAASA